MIRLAMFSNRRGRRWPLLAPLSALFGDASPPPPTATPGSNGGPSGQAHRDEPPPLEPQDELVPGYQVRRHLRRGRPFDVYEVWSQERHCSCVAKTPRPAAEPERAQAMLRREGQRLLSFTHPHLVRAYEVLDVPRPAMVLETLQGQTVQHHIHEAGRPLVSGELACLGLHLCAALSYLHHHHLLHLDLKPSNIIFDSGRAKLIDLSLARPPGPGQRGTGTPAYLSPEQATGGVHRGHRCLGHRRRSL